MTSSKIHADSPQAATPPDVQDWQCGVCLELLYKPCVAPPCGHIHCFWSVCKIHDALIAVAQMLVHVYGWRVVLPRVCTKHAAVLSNMPVL